MHLAWEFWNGREIAPWLVDYTEDRDLWRHKLPDSEEINAALRSYPLDFELWDTFENIGFHQGEHSFWNKQFYLAVAVYRRRRWSRNEHS